MATGNAHLGSNVQEQNGEERGNEDSGHHFSPVWNGTSVFDDANAAVDLNYFIDTTNKVNRCKKFLL